MTVYAAPGATFEASVANGTTGLTGTLGVRISNLATDVDFLARTTAGITEYPAASGIYARSFTAPTAAGTFALIWDTGGVTPIYAREDLVVTSSSPGGATPSGSDLCVVADVKAAVGIPAATTNSDALIQVLITSASKALSTRYQHDFYPIASATRRFHVKNRLVGLEPYDLRAASLVSLNPEATSPTTLVAGTDYDLKPAGGTSTMGTYTELLLSNYLWVNSPSVQAFGYANLDITATWGPTAIPVDVARACAITAAAWMDAGADQIAGYDSTVRNDGSTMAASWAIPSAAHRLMQAYERFSVYVA